MKVHKQKRKPTPSCNLSSTAVAPTRIKSFSIKSATCSRRSSLSDPIVVFALTYSLFHAEYSDSSSFRYASTRVRSPASPYSFRCLLVSSLYALPFFESRSNMMLNISKPNYFSQSLFGKTQLDSIEELRSVYISCSGKYSTHIRTSTT